MPNVLDFLTQPESSLIPRPSPPPVLDRLQYAKLALFPGNTASDQELEAGKVGNEAILRELTEV